MRRPLFVVCLCLVIIIGLRAERSDWSDLDRANCIVTGRVYQKDTEYFYLDSIHSIYSEYDTANPQQINSFTDNFICENDGETEVLIGSTVRVSGTFNAFSRAGNPGEFDMAEYYHSLEIGGKLRNVTILEQSEKYSRLQEVLYQIKAYFKERLYHIFPKKEASIMCAMLLGDKKELDADVKHLYQQNGIVHILSISGLHITIIGVSIYGMLRKGGLPIWLAAIWGGGILLLYGIMTGMSVSACRAIGMYLLRMLSEVVGRTYDMLTALGVMALVVVWSNPGYLHNAGFYLSFGAVLGIGMLYPALFWEKQENTVVVMYEGRRWKQLANKLTKKLRNGLKQSILSGLSVTLMTLPVQLWFYYEIPTYSVFINLFVIPFMSIVMICGLLAMLVPGLGLLGTVDCLILGGYERLCHCFEGLPFHRWNPGKPEWWQLLAYYLLLAGVLAIRHAWECRKDAAGTSVLKKMKEKKGEQIFILTIAVILLALHPNKKTTVTFLDVGQGDCICLQLESGEVYLFDCGSSSRSQVGAYVLKPFLKYYGIQEIDAVFVSHPDEDHCNGVLELLRNQSEWGIAVKQLVLPDLEDTIWQTQFGELTGAVNGDESRGCKTNVMLSGNEGRKTNGILPENEGGKTNVMLSGNKEGKTVNFCEILNLNRNNSGTKVTSLKAGDSWSVGENYFLCLHPPKDCTLQESNAFSQCLYISLADGVSLLLTGDVEEEGEDMLLEELVQRDIKDITLLKVAHHGSKHSTETDFLEQIQPQVAVISCGANNFYGHPHGETLERLEDVGSVIMTTAECGAVALEIGQRIEICCYKELDKLNTCLWKLRNDKKQKSIINRKKMLYF